MDEKLIEQIQEHDGWLTIRGYGINRAIFLFNERLEHWDSQKVYNHSPDGFNWGYSGSGPAQLALAICLKIFDREIALKQYQLFKDSLVALFPAGGFIVEVNVDEWSRIAGKPELEPPVHAYSLMNVCVNKEVQEEMDRMFVAKFIDFPNLPYKKAIFDSTTTEYHYLMEIFQIASLWETYQNYIKTHTDRKDVNLKKSIHAIIDYLDDGDVFYLEDGLGSVDAYFGYPFTDHQKAGVLNYE